MQKPTVAFINDRIVPIDQAQISILDRGFLFADGVYEVAAVIRGKLIDLPAHLARLGRSLREIKLPSPHPLEEIPTLMERLVQIEQLDEGLVYLQITRGADRERGFHFPAAAHCQPTFVMFGQSKPLLHDPVAESGASVISIPDIRWKRRDIKSIALLPQVLGKQAAHHAGAFEAWMIEDGLVTEGTSSAAAIITRENELITRPPSPEVLDSITQRAILKLVADTQLSHQPRPFSLEEAYAAAEAFTASATALITPIIRIDDHPIGTGKPGPWSRRLREEYLKIAMSDSPIMATFPDN